jgi:outer membrane receptor for ferrienterochelin and colicins
MDKSSDWDNDNYEIEINYSRLFLGRYTLTAGYQLLEEDVDDRGKNYKADQTLHSFFIQGEIDFLPFTFVLGARLDEHDKWGTAVNPKASFLYRITEGFKLRGSIGSAFRAPSLVKLYGEGWRMGPFLVHANPDLKPEESIGYQLGAEYMLSEKLSSKLSFFRNEANYLINAQYNEIGPPPWDMNWENIVEVTTQGIEFNLASQIMDNLTGKLGYTFLDTEDESTGKELTYKPNHKLSLELGYKVSKIDLNMNLESEYIGRRYDSDYNKLGGYAIFNLALTKDIRKNIEIFVRVDNIFDKKDIYDEYDIDGAEFLGGVKVRF